VAWLLEELGVPYELRFTPGDVFGSLTQIQENSGHGFPMAPVVRDGEDLLIESAAILETLMNRHGDGGLRPPVSAPNHAAYLEWLHFAESSAMPRFSMEALERRLPPSKNPVEQARRGGASVRVLTYVDEALASRPYLAGQDFTAADIQNHFVLRIGASIAAERKGYPAALLQPTAECYKDYPNLAAYMQRLEARPAFQRMMAATMPQGWPAV
jgi:glutathione S-transferase